MPPTDIAELRRLHEAATSDSGPGSWGLVEDHEQLYTLTNGNGNCLAGDICYSSVAAFLLAAHNALPALLDELEAAREENERLQADNAKLAWAWDEVQSDTPKQAQDKARIIQAAVVCLNSLAWLDARDRRMKAIGAAEGLERSAKTLREDLADMNPPEFASRGKVAPGYCECLQDVADGMEERAAQLRQEAEG